MECVVRPTSEHTEKKSWFAWTDSKSLRGGSNDTAGVNVRLGRPDQPETRGSEKERRKDRRKSVGGLR